MTIPATGPVNLSAVGSEVLLPLLSPVSMNNVEVRKLANKTTANSLISMNDFHGTSYGQGGGYGAADFTSVINQYPDTVVTSNVIYITGAGVTPVSFAIFSTQAAQYSINAGAWTDKSILGSIKNGDTLQVRITTGTYGETKGVTAQFNGVTKPFNTSVGAKLVLNVYFLYNRSSGGILTCNLQHTAPPAYQGYIGYEGGELSPLPNGQYGKYYGANVTRPAGTGFYWTHFTIPYIDEGYTPEFSSLVAINNINAYGHSSEIAPIAAGTWGNLYNVSPYNTTGGGTILNGVYYRAAYLDPSASTMSWTIREHGDAYVP